MPRGGPGRGQGRKRGSKSRTTLERENAALAEQLRTRKVSRTDLDVMLEIRDFWMGYAATEQREAANQKRLPDLDKMAKALDLAGTMAAKRAPFLHAKLSSVTVREEELDLTRLSDAELSALQLIRAKAAIGRSDHGGVGQTLQ